MNEYKISSFSELAKCMDAIRDLPLDGTKMVIIQDAEPKQRTLTQNNCLHEYIKNLSDALNEGGFDVKETITVPVDFTPETVKKYMFHPIMKAMYPEKESTKELDKIQISKVYENLNRLTSDKFGIGLDWPSRFTKG